MPFILKCGVTRNPEHAPTASDCEERNGEQTEKRSMEAVQGCNNDAL